MRGEPQGCSTIRERVATDQGLGGRRLHLLCIKPLSVMVKKAERSGNIRTCRRMCCFSDLHKHDGGRACECCSKPCQFIEPLLWEEQEELCDAHPNEAADEGSKEHVSRLG